MKLSGFSFKTEAVWMTLASYGVPLIGLLVLLIVMLSHYLRS